MKNKLILALLSLLVLSGCAPRTRLPDFRPTITSFNPSTPTATVLPTAIPTEPPTPTVTSTPMPSAEATPAPLKPGWRLLFEEHFDYPQLNTSVWHPQNRWGTVNPPEKECYTHSALEIHDSDLVITARQQVQDGMPYTSGMVATYGNLNFQYGYVEMRARIPAGKGLWAAFWLLASDPKSENEIDVMEILGNEPGNVFMTLHYNRPGDQPGSSGIEYEGANFSTDYHTYAVDWSPRAVIWYIDGQERYRLVENVPHEPMYLLANLAVGGTWPGNPDKSTHFPAMMVIDYVRVFQKQ